jgi:two-component system sensor histidine kinase UhpB
MSLRYQISLRILLISAVILFVGGAISVWQARKAVSKEVDSSIGLALALIKIGIGTTTMHKTDWMRSLSSLEQTRHLKIQLKTSSGELINLSNRSLQNTEQNETPPTWFINLVESDYPKIEYQIETVSSNHLILIIQADPLDEISEVWQETITFFMILLLLVLLTFLSVHLVLDKTLLAIQSIVEHLKGIEIGNYKNKLSDFSTQEYADIASAINHMTDVLDHTQQQNRTLTQHSLSIQEDERRRLSQELHDEFGQSLTAIKVMAVTAAHEQTDTKKITASITKICDHLMVVVRSMMKQLHPLILTELGLKATLEDIVNQWKSRNALISFTLYCDSAVDNLEPTIVIQIFRVIQESLTNIIRHAGAMHVTINITLTENPDVLELLIIDDGQGYEAGKATSGFGLLGMAERVKLLGGSFTIKSQIKEGTQIDVKIPLI